MTRNREKRAEAKRLLTRNREKRAEEKKWLQRNREKFKILTNDVRFSISC